MPHVRRVAVPIRGALLAVLAGAALAAGGVVATGCGAPEQLERDDDRRLIEAREELDDALDTEETIRTSPEMARLLSLRVRAQQAAGNAERLEEITPSLVRPDGSIDGEAVEAFLRHARTDAPRALLPPATAAVDEIVEVIDDSGADAETKVPSQDDRPLGRYVDGIERDIRDVWPALASRLDDTL